MEALLVIGAIAVLMGSVIAAALWFGRKRQEAMAAIAQQLNLKFYPKGDSSLSPLLAQLKFFASGKYPQVRNLMKGTIQRAGETLTVAIFDYYYTIGRRDKTDTFGQTVLLFFDESLRLPSFSLRPEHLFDRLGNVLGFEDINFPEFSSFSKRYRLQGDSEQSVRSLFQPNLLKFYEKQKICTEAQGATLVIFPADDGRPHSQSIRLQTFKTYTESRLIQPNEVQPFLDTGLRLVSLLRHNQ